MKIKDKIIHISQSIRICKDNKPIGCNHSCMFLEINYVINAFLKGKKTMIFWYPLKI